MLWAPQDPGNVCPAPDSCFHPADLEDDRAPSPMPPSVKSARLGTVSSSGQHRLASWARSIRVATSGLCWLRSQHRWLMNMKSLFHVKSLWLFFFSRLIPSVPCKLYTKLYEPRRKGVSTKTLNVLAWYHFHESQISVLNTCVWIQYLFCFVWGRRAKDISTVLGCLLSKFQQRGREKNNKLRWKNKNLPFVSVLKVSLEGPSFTPPSHLPLITTLEARQRRKLEAWSSLGLGHLSEQSRDCGFLGNQRKVLEEHS